jgi:hypothetical protein
MIPGALRRVTNETPESLGQPVQYRPLDPGATERVATRIAELI